jgi:hypothetical protein
MVHVYNYTRGWGSEGLGVEILPDFPGIEQPPDPQKCCPGRLGKVRAMGIKTSGDV